MVERSRRGEWFAVDSDRLLRTGSGQVGGTQGTISDPENLGLGCVDLASSLYWDGRPQGDRQWAKDGASVRGQKLTRDSLQLGGHHLVCNRGPKILHQVDHIGGRGRDTVDNTDTCRGRSEVEPSGVLV